MVWRDGKEVRDQCAVWSDDHQHGETMSCTKWDYDNNTYKTVIDEFDLVCDRAFLADLSQTVHFGGLLVG